MLLGPLRLYLDRPDHQVLLELQDAQVIPDKDHQDLPDHLGHQVMEDRDLKGTKGTEEKSAFPPTQDHITQDHQDQPDRLDRLGRKDHQVLLDPEDTKVNREFLDLLEDLEAQREFRPMVVDQDFLDPQDLLELPASRAPLRPLVRCDSTSPTTSAESQRLAFKDPLVPQVLQDFLGATQALSVTFLLVSSSISNLQTPALG